MICMFLYEVRTDQFFSATKKDAVEKLLIFEFLVNGERDITIQMCYWIVLMNLQN